MKIEFLNDIEGDANIVNIEAEPISVAIIDPASTAIPVTIPTIFKGSDGSDGLPGRDGSDGKSAYEIAIQNGFTGSKTEWLASLKGEKGRDGIDGINGINGIDGQDGRDGKSAYELAVDDGFTGSESEWLASLKGNDGISGVDGSAGDDGKSAYQLAVENGFVGSEADWLASLKGSDGSAGKSAYQLAVEAGFVGSQADYLTSLKGADGSAGADGNSGIDGKSAYQIAVEAGFTGSESEWLASLKGADGSAGVDGINGSAGKSAYQLAVEAGFVGSQADYLTSLKGADGSAGAGVPAGGSTGQILSKASNTDLDTVWINAPTGTGGGTTLPTGTAGDILTLDASGNNVFQKIKRENFGFNLNDWGLPQFQLYGRDDATYEERPFSAVIGLPYFKEAVVGVDYVIPFYSESEIGGFAKSFLMSDPYLVPDMNMPAPVLTVYDVGYNGPEYPPGLVRYDENGLIISYSNAIAPNHVVTKSQMDAAIAAIPTGGGGGSNHVVLSQADYDALATKDPNTFYHITG